MSQLVTKRNIDKPDDIYQQLIDIHVGLDDTTSLQLYARLILILMNHIGDETILYEAMVLAQKANGSIRNP